MPLNPNIPLQVQTPNIGGGIQQIANIKRANTAERRNEEDRQLNQKLTKQQIEANEINLDNSRFANVAAGAQAVLDVWEATGDRNQVAEVLAGRRQGLADAGKSTLMTDEAYGLATGSDEDFQKLLDSSNLIVGEGIVRGVIDPNKQTPIQRQNAVNSLDALVETFPEDIKPFLDKRNFGGDVDKWRTEILKVRQSLEGDNTQQLKMLIDKAGNKSTVLWDTKGGFSDLEGNKITPSSTDMIVSASIQASGAEELSDTERRQLNDSEVATRNFVGTIGDALSLLKEHPDVNTFVASAGSVINSLQAEAKAFARAGGMDFNDSVFDASQYDAPNKGSGWEGFDALGITNVRMKGLATSLAFQAAAASGQSGRDVSDKDVARFLKEIGISSDSRAMATTLIDVGKRSERSFINNYEVRLREEFTGDVGLNSVIESFSGAPESNESSLPKEVGQQVIINGVPVTRTK